MPLLTLLAYAGVAFLFGMALGERGELGAVQHVFMIVIPIATIVLAAVARKGRAAVALTGAVMLAGLLLGRQQFESAWQGCPAEAEGVRQALLRHHATAGGYPSRLEDLGIDLPCRCGLRRTILHYLSNERGFRLWISDDAETWSGTERSLFTASGRSSAPQPR